MNPEQIIRAWKDEDYRAGLSGAELDVMPAHPAGVIELHAAELEGVAGGYSTEQLMTFGCCFTPSGFWWCALDSVGIRTVIGCCQPVDKLE